eukprot:TRINITY_DN6550_c0_g1_i1.p1 TRINITY_DN6550_c0_g1~~TRINITY_DN6550_c0_g1_i1.p1  ORF type:complete len:62 (-),score=10.11 TRINITY_DN6550_c0_g1_i1:20-205(-)
MYLVLTALFKLCDDLHLCGLHALNWDELIHLSAILKAFYLATQELQDDGSTCVMPIWCGPI